MTLRTRIGLAAVGLTIAIVAGFGALAYSVFTQQQGEQLQLILNEDLQRVTALLDRPTLGASFAPGETDGVILQLVSPDGQVAVDWGGAELLPVVDEPTLMELGGRTYIVTTGVWPSTDGSVRLAHDVTAALAVRTGLVASLLGAAVIVVIVAGAAAFLAARRMLAPLAEVSERARSVDPAAPAAVSYAGPADEIGDLVAALNTALSAIQDRKRAEREFLLEVSHELAAPLTLVNYHLGAVRDEHPDDSRVRAAADGTRELLRTSQDLLQLARGELERELKQRVVDLRQVVQRVGDEYPEVRLELGERLEVVGDPERLTQVVRNLVRNAIQSVDSREAVEVSLRQDGDAAVVSVKDEGPGMSQETVTRIFDHGFSRAGGVGVGLTVCKRLVEQHEGELRIRSVLGEGSTFEVRLPTLAARLDQADHADEVPPSEATP